MAPTSGGTCQPDIATMWHALRGSDYELDLDIDKLMEAEEIFKECMKDYFMPPEAKAVEPLIPWSPMPGGALTANTQMMRDNGIMDRYPEVIAAMGEVVRLGGFGTSVTPVSQFYFQQAFNNVMFGKWEKFADGYGKMVLGYFGKTPVPPDPEIVKLAAEKMGLEPTTRDPLEINEEDATKGIAPAQKMLEDAGLEPSEENIFITAACKEKGIAFLKGEAKTGVRKNVPEEAPSAAATEVSDTYTVNVSGKKFVVKFDGDQAKVDGTNYDLQVAEGAEEAPSAAGAVADGTPVNAKMPGAIVKVLKTTGNTVAEGEVLFVLEAMKMEMEIVAPAAGTITRILVKQGDQVTAGQELATLT